MKSKDKTVESMLHWLYMRGFKTGKESTVGYINTEMDIHLIKKDLWQLIEKELDNPEVAHWKVIVVKDALKKLILGGE